MCAWGLLDVSPALFAEAATTALMIHTLGKLPLVGILFQGTRWALACSRRG